MPVTYRDPLQGVSLSVAAAEAAAIAPITRAMLDTLEFHRSDILDAAGVHTAIRLVVDKQDLLATLEADAPLGAGTEVTFLKVGLRVVKPAESEDAQSPSFEIELDGVSTLCMRLFDEMPESMEPTLMYYRVYASDDTSGPAVTPPLVMEVATAGVGETRVRISCGFGDPINEGFPGLTYTRAQYPGLSAR